MEAKLKFFLMLEFCFWCLMYLLARRCSLVFMPSDGSYRFELLLKDAECADLERTECLLIERRLS